MAQGSTRGVPIDIDATLALDSDLVVPSQKAIKTYVDNGLALKQGLLGYTPVNKAGDTMIGDLILNADPTYALQAATKKYVDENIVAGIQLHDPVRVESTGNLNATYVNGGTTPTITTIAGNTTLTSTAHGLSINDVIVFDTTANGLTAGTPYFVFSTPTVDTFTLSLSFNGVQITTLTNGTGLTLTSRANSGVGATLTNAGTQAALIIDGITMAVNDRILVRLQTNASQNGVYVVSNIGSGSTNWVLTRATDSNKYAPKDPNRLGEGDYYYTTSGTLNAGDSHILNSSGTIVFGTTLLSFAQFSGAVTYSGGTNIDVTGQIISLTGQVAVANGGTGASTLTGVLIGNGTSPVTGITGTASQLLRRNVANTAYEFFTPSYILLTSLSATSPLNYDNTTGAFSITQSSGSQNGYLSSTDWTTFNSKQNAITLTTTGTTGAATFISDTLNIPQYQGQITLTTTGNSGAATFISNTLNVPNYTLSGLGGVPTTRTLTINSITYDLSADRTWTIGPTIYSRGLQRFVATAGQTSFTITNGYTVGLVDVYRNGVKLDNATEFTASNGTTVVLTDAAALNDIIEVYKYGSEYIPNNALRTVNTFTATAAQTTFSVTYSVGLLDVFYNGSKLAAAEYTATNGTTVVFANACTAGDIIEIIAYNYLVNAYAGISGSGTTNYVSKFTASGTIGNSIIFDNGTNVGIGIAPSSWYTGYTALNIGYSGAIWSNKTSSDTNTTMVGNNTYLNSSATNWIYQNNGFATRYAQVSGEHQFYSAASGTAGNAITWGTAKLTIASTGNMGIGTSSPSTKLNTFISNDLNTIQIRAESDTSSVVSYTGIAPSVIEYYRNVATGVDLTIQTKIALGGAGGNIVFAPQGTTTSLTPVERMRITKEGNVGINATDPVKTLDVRGTLAISNSVSSYWYMDRDDSDGRFKILTDANAERFSITTGGDVLISTSTSATNPNGFARVLNVRNTDAALVLSNTSGTTKDWSIGAFVGGYLAIFDGTSERFRIASTGAATFSSTVTATGESFITGSDGGGKMLKFTGGTTKFNWMIAAQQNVNNGLEITPSSAAGGSTFSTPAIVVTSGGNVGINISNPDVKLHVYGVPNTNNDAVYNLILQDPSAYNTRIGAGISFGGFYDTTNTSFTFANIKGFKENTTLGDYAGALAFTTRTNGGNPTERMRITSGGIIQIRNGSTVAGEIKPTGVDNDMTINGSRGQISFQINGTEEYAMDSLQFYPTPDNANALGTASLRWTAVYAANGTIQTSDRNEKNNIVASDLGLDYISKLKPVSYNWIKGDNKKHYGLIAQDIEELGIEFGGLNIENGKYALNYSEFISPLIKAIQELNEKIKILENK
jgi:hypothetical protein